MGVARLLREWRTALDDQLHVSIEWRVFSVERDTFTEVLQYAVKIIADEAPEAVHELSQIVAIRQSIEAAPGVECVRGLTGCELEKAKLKARNGEIGRQINRPAQRLMRLNVALSTGEQRSTQEVQPRIFGMLGDHIADFLNGIAAALDSLGQSAQRGFVT